MPLVNLVNYQQNIGLLVQNSLPLHVGSQPGVGHASTDVTEKVYAYFLPNTLAAEVARLQPVFNTLSFNN